MCPAAAEMTGEEFKSVPDLPPSVALVPEVPPSVEIGHSSVDAAGPSSMAPPNSSVEVPPPSVEVTKPPTTLEKMMSTQSCGTAKSEREYKVIIWGATGYTGKLACQHLLQYNMERVMRGERAIPWAPAGRNRSALESLTATLRMQSKTFSTRLNDISRQQSAKDENEDATEGNTNERNNEHEDHLNALRKKSEESCPSNLAKSRSRRVDSGDWEVFGTNYLCVEPENINDVKSMTARTAVIACFAGPFTQCGENVVRACLATNTDYVDATAELDWVMSMKQKFDKAAQSSNLTFLPCCGYDFLVNDMMMYQLASYLQARPKLQPHPVKVQHLFDQSTKSVSGGTARSGLLLLQNTPFKDLVRAYTDPYTCVNMDIAGKKDSVEPGIVEEDTDIKHNSAASPDTAVKPDSAGKQDTVKQMALPEANRYWVFPEAVRELDAYVTPFVMSNLMSKYVHWANLQSDYSWGKGLVYRGGMRRSNVFLAIFEAILIWVQFVGAVILSRLPFLWEFLPKPGNGPQIVDEQAYLNSDLVASVRPVGVGHQTKVRISWRMKGAEAYKAAAIFVVQCAVLMAEQQKTRRCGFTTPSIALGDHLVKRLKEAGVEMTECEVPSL